MSNSAFAQKQERTKIIYTLLLFLISGFYHLNAQTFSWVEKSNLKHPYLYFTEQEKPKIIENIKQNANMSELFEGFKQQARKLMAANIEKDNFPEGDDYTFYGSRILTQRKYRNAAYLLSFLYQMTGEINYAKKAFEYADAVCEMPRWTNRYHEFRIIYDRVWPYNCKDDQVSFNVDLEVTNTALALAVVYDWLYPTLNKKEKDRIRGALLEKVILPVKGNYEYHWWASAYKCNWAAVNNANIGVAVLSILIENPELENMVFESYERNVKTLDHCGLDGGWQEGYSYLNYAVSQAALFAEPLKRLTNGKKNLFKHSTMSQGLINCAINSIIAPNYSVNFADCGSLESARTYVINKIAEETGNGNVTWFRQNRLGKPSDVMDIIWPESKVKPVSPVPVSHLFESIGWAVLRTDFLDENKPVLSCKAGSNDDPHHGHLDCGSFNIWWRGEGFISELGRGLYDEDFFTEKRWENPYAATVGHQTIIVNGENQITAKYKDKPWKEGVGGEVLKFEKGGSKDYVLLDPSNAYPKAELKKWRRHIIFDKPDVSLIVDEISAKPNSNIEMIFNTGVNFEIKNNHVLLSGKKGKMILFPISKAALRVEKRNHQIMAPEGLSIKNGTLKEIPYFVTVFLSKDEISYVFTLIVPYEDEESIAELGKSIKLNENNPNTIEFSFTMLSKNYKYNFNLTNGGLLTFVQ